MRNLLLLTIKLLPEVIGFYNNLHCLKLITSDVKSNFSKVIRNFAKKSIFSRHGDFLVRQAWSSVAQKLKFM